MNETKKAIMAEQVTRIIGEPTRQQVEELQRELAEIAVKFSTGMFDSGDEYGHMCLVVNQNKYREVIGDNAWTYVAPVKPGAFDTTLTNAAGDLLRKRRIAEHERKIEEHELFRGVMNGLKEQILFTVNEQYLRGLKQPLVGYARVTALEMLTYLFDNCTMGTMDLDQLEESLNEPWNADDHINEFIRKLDEKREKLNGAGIAVSDQQIVVKFVKQMYHSGNFDELDLTNWERRATADKTYANAKTYFQEKYREKLMYRKATARNMGYVNKTEEIKEQLTEVLTQMAAAQQADHEYINATTETTTKSMEAMMKIMLEQQKQMTTFMEKFGKPRISNNNNNKGGKQHTDKETCPVCKKKAHKGGVEECWDDPKNKHKRPLWYVKMLKKKAAKKKDS